MFNVLSCVSFPILCWLFTNQILQKKKDSAVSVSKNNQFCFILVRHFYGDYRLHIPLLVTTLRSTWFVWRIALYMTFGMQNMLNFKTWFFRCFGPKGTVRAVFDVPGLARWKCSENKQEAGNAFCLSKTSITEQKSFLTERRALLTCKVLVDNGRNLWYCSVDGFYLSQWNSCFHLQWFIP